MTTSVPIPAVDTAPSMANPSDTASEKSTEQAPARARAATAVRPSLRAQAAENPLLSLFGLVIVALLAAAVASPNIRINDTNGRIDRLEDKMDARFDRLEDKTDARFGGLEDKMDARFGGLEDKMDARFGGLEDKTDARFGGLDEAVAAIDLKLTALITHLNATSEVDNALAGRLTGPNAPTAARRPEP